MNDIDINEFLEDCNEFSDFDDDIEDPDFIIPNQENNLSDNQDDVMMIWKVYYVQILTLNVKILP